MYMIHPGRLVLKSTYFCVIILIFFARTISATLAALSHLCAFIFRILKNSPANCNFSYHATGAARACSMIVLYRGLRISSRQSSFAREILTNYLLCEADARTLIS